MAFIKGIMFQKLCKQRKSIIVILSVTFYQIIYSNVYNVYNIYEYMS